MKSSLAWLYIKANLELSLSLGCWGPGSEQRGISWHIWPSLLRHHHRILDGSRKGHKSWRLKIFVLNPLEEQMSDLASVHSCATISASPLSSDCTLCTFLHTSVYHRKSIVLCFYFHKLPCFKFSFSVLEMLFTRFIKCNTIYTICHSITINGYLTIFLLIDYWIVLTLSLLLQTIVVWPFFI